MSEKTLAMWYWSVSSIGKYLPSKVQHNIVKYLNASPVQPAIRTAGVIIHARKYYERGSLTAEYKELARKALDCRLNTNKNINLAELTHLKLIA